MLIRQLIADAIQEADKSYFNENYTEQALQVLITLNKEGFKVVPLQADEEIIKLGVESIKYGDSTPENLVKTIYEAMVKNFKG